MDLLTEAELRAMRLTADLVNTVVLEVFQDGPSFAGDLREFVALVHQIQHMIMSQAAARAYPDLFRLLGGLVDSALDDQRGVPARQAEPPADVSWIHFESVRKRRTRRKSRPEWAPDTPGAD